MKVIELLTKIANGEDVPEKIKYHLLAGNTLEDFFENFNYFNGDYYNTLNDEVEIIENKKIEKIEYSIDKDGYLSVNDFREHLLQIINKINEIIDYINGGTNGE